MAQKMGWPKEIAQRKSIVVGDSWAPRVDRDAAGLVCRTVKGVAPSPRCRLRRRPHRQDRGRRHAAEVPTYGSEDADRGFRPQIFVTRAYTVGIAGLNSEKPTVGRVYDAFGRMTDWPN
jgi:hypothetical protein